MQATDTTRLSAKGQVVIPEAIRARLGLEPGTGFLVMAEDDVVVLERLDAPSIREYDSVIGKLREAAKEAGVRPSGVRDAPGRVQTVNNWFGGPRLRAPIRAGGPAVPMLPARPPQADRHVRSRRTQGEPGASLVGRAAGAVPPRAIGHPAR
jgi:AbrB family looped-hinge helix DNA binding protein